MTLLHPRIVSVIVVSYNTRGLLERFLRALPDAVRLADEGGCPRFTLDVIVVDNASTDDSVEMVRAAFRDVRVIENRDNRGYACAVNQGLRAAAGDVLVIANSDVFFPAGSLAMLASIAASEPRVGALSPQLRYPDGRWQRTSGVDISPLGALADLVIPRRSLAAAYTRVAPGWHTRGLHTLVNVPYVDGAALVTRRDVLQRIGLFDERFFFYSEDADFCARVRKAGYRVAIARDCRVIHERSASSKDDNSTAIGSSHMAMLVASEVRYVSLHHGQRAAERVRRARVLRYRTRAALLSALASTSPLRNVVERARQSADRARQWRRLWKEAPLAANTDAFEGAANDATPPRTRVAIFGLCSRPGAIKDDVETLTAALADETADQCEVALVEAEAMLPAACSRTHFVRDGVTRFSIPYGRPFVRTLLSARLRRALAAVRAWHPDVVLLYAPTPLNTLLSLMFRGSRIVYYWHEPWLRACYRRSVAQHVMHALRVFVARQADLLLVSSEYVREHLVDRGYDRERVHVAPLPLQQAFVNAATGAPEGSVASDVLFVGRFDGYKGLEVLWQALDALRARGLVVRALLIGPGDLESASPSFARDAAGVGATIINRYVPHDEVAAAVAATRLVALPYTEATGTTVPQLAYWHRKPVVASNVGGLPDYVRDRETGLLVPPRDPRALANAIEELLGNSALCEALGNNGYHFVTNELSGCAVAKTLAPLLAPVDCVTSVSGS